MTEREQFEAWVRSSTVEVPHRDRHGFYDEPVCEWWKVWQAARAQPAQAGAEPVAWQGGEGWESLAWELCADENGEESCDELVWEGGPIPEPWDDRWMKYEGEAKRLIALVHKHTAPIYAHPPARVPLTEEEVRILDNSTHFHESHDWSLRFARSIEAAHGIGGGK